MLFSPVIHRLWILAKRDSILRTTTEQVALLIFGSLSMRYVTFLVKSATLYWKFLPWRLLYIEVILSRAPSNLPPLAARFLNLWFLVRQRGLFLKRTNVILTWIITVPLRAIVKTYLMVAYCTVPGLCGRLQFSPKPHAQGGCMGNLIKWLLYSSHKALAQYKNVKKEVSPAFPKSLIAPPTWI